MAVSIGRPILRFLLLGIVAMTCLSITWMILWTWNESVTRVKESPSASILGERSYPGRHSKTVLEWLDLNESSSDTVPRWAPEDKKPPRKAVSNWVHGTVPQTTGTTWSERLKTTSQPLNTKSPASASVSNIKGLSRREANRFRQNSRLDDLLYPEASRLGFINDFEFMINRDVCGEDPVDLLVLIGSHPKFTALRKMLRETWGGPRIDDYVIRLVFFFGRPKEARVQQDLMDESLAYGDIIQGNFQDHYHNITYRDLMAFRWTWRLCPQARYVMRSDDDMVIDIDGVLQALETQMPKGRDYLACMSVFHGMRVLRQGQYAVSREEHPQDVYKPYCQGWTYWLTPGTCKALDDVALKTKPFWMNDAYLTGALMAALGWSHRLLYVPYTNNMIEMIEFLECPFEERPLFALGPSLDIAKTRVLHKRFSLRAQKIGIPNRDPDKAPPGPYYQRNFRNCNSAQERRNRPPHPWVGSLQPGIRPLPSGIIPQQTGYPWQSGMTPQQPGMTPQQPEMTPQQPGLYPWKSGMTPQQPGITSQEPGIAPQKPGIAPQEPGIAPQKPGIAPLEPGIAPQEPGIAPQEHEIAPKEPGIAPLEPEIAPLEPGIAPQEPGMTPQQPGLYPWKSRMTPQQPGIAPKEPGIAPKEPGIAPQKPGIAPQEPGIAPQKPGIAPLEPGIAPQEHEIAPKEPGIAPLEPEIAPLEPGIAPQEPGMTPQQPGLYPWKSRMTPQQPGIAPKEPGIAPKEPGIAPQKPGIAPLEPGISPQKPGMTPEQPGLTNQLPGLASEKNPLLIHSPHQEVEHPPSGIPPQHPGLRHQLPGPSPDKNPELISGNDKTHEPPPSLQFFPGLLYENTEAHEQVMRREALNVIMPEIKAETSIPKEQGGKPEEQIGHSYKVVEKRPQSGLRTQQPKVVLNEQSEMGSHQPMQSFQWPADDHHRQSPVSIN